MGSRRVGRVSLSYHHCRTVILRQVPFFANHICDCYVIAMWLLCDCYVITMCVLCGLQVPFFANCHKVFLKTLVPRLRPLVIMQGEFVFKAEAISSRDGMSSK